MIKLLSSVKKLQLLYALQTYIPVRVVELIQNVKEHYRTTLGVN